MKRILYIIIIAILLATGLSREACAAPSNKSVFQPGNDIYILNNRIYSMDTIPFIKNNRVFLPVRYLAYACGVNEKDINWDSLSQTVMIKIPGTHLSLKIGSKELKKNGAVIQMDVAPVLICDRTFLPVRWVSEAINYQVEWHQPSKSLLIYPPDETKPNPMEPLGFLLVNKSHALAMDYKPKSLVDFEGCQVSSALQQPLQSLFTSAGRLNMSFTLNSCYRSYERQEQLFNERVAAYGLREASLTVAPPGCSEHQTGLAIDLDGDSDYANSWLEANCWRFGFVLRYPRDKEGITGYSYEPWHFRYLGVPVAAFMHENNVLTLEEFIDTYTAY
ncbi:MAG: D-alanyl-D-alanine carboxypeptidase family protein [Desulfotomaculaceae bacterium]